MAYDRAQFNALIFHNQVMLPRASPGFGEVSLAVAELQGSDPGGAAFAGFVVQWDRAFAFSGAVGHCFSPGHQARIVHHETEAYGASVARACIARLGVSVGNNASGLTSKTAHKCSNWWSRTSTCRASILASQDRLQSQPLLCNLTANSACDQSRVARSRRTVGPTAFIGLSDDGD